MDFISPLATVWRGKSSTYVCLVSVFRCLWINRHCKGKGIWWVRPGQLLIFSWRIYPLWGLSRGGVQSRLGSFLPLNRVPGFCPLWTVSRQWLRGWSCRQIDLGLNWSPTHASCEVLGHVSIPLSLCFFNWKVRQMMTVAVTSMLISIRELLWISQCPLQWDWPCDWRGQWDMNGSDASPFWAKVGKCPMCSLHTFSFFPWCSWAMEAAWVLESPRGWEACKRDSWEISLSDFEIFVTAASIHYPDTVVLPWELLWKN